MLPAVAERLFDAVEKFGLFDRFGQIRRDAQCAAAGDVDNEWWSSAQLVTIRWYQGRLGELLPMLHDRVHSPVLRAVDN